MIALPEHSLVSCAGIYQSVCHDDDQSRSFYLSARNGGALAFWASVMRIGLIASVFVTAFGCLPFRRFSRFFHVSDILLGLVCHYLPGTPRVWEFRISSGSLRFRAAAVLAYRAGSKVRGGAGFVFSGLGEYVYLSNSDKCGSGGILVVFLIPRSEVLWYVLPQTRSFPIIFSAAILVTVSTAMFTTMDVLLAKHFMSERGTGYAFSRWLVGDFSLGTMPNMFNGDVCGKESRTWKGTEKCSGLFMEFLLVVAGACFSGIFDGVVSEFLFGEKISAVSRFLHICGCYRFLYTLNHYRYVSSRAEAVRFVFAVLLMSGAESIGIILFMSLSTISWTAFFFRAYLGGFY